VTSYTQSITERLHGTLALLLFQADKGGEKLLMCH